MNVYPDHEDESMKSPKGGRGSRRKNKEATKHVAFKEEVKKGKTKVEK